MQSIVSGKIARLVLIQLQFVKKELLVAMQAIDELFNANQVNLQLLAITPAVLSILSLQILSKTFIVALRATSRGRVAESASAIHRDLRDCVRDVERSLSLSNGFNEGGALLSSIQLGKLLSALHRLQSILVVNSTIFDYHVLMQLQVGTLNMNGSSCD
jgi:nuclear-control-of-ATPase protein 2